MSVLLFVDSPDVRDKSAVGDGEGSCELDPGEAEDVSEGIGDSRGVAGGVLSGTGEFSGLGNPDASEGLFGGFAGEASGVAEETARAIEISRF
jgi:hypothetical protein